MANNDALRGILNHYFPGRYSFEERDNTLLTEDKFQLAINEVKVSADTVLIEHLLNENFFERIVNGSIEDQKTMLEAISHLERGDKIQVFGLFVKHYHQHRKLSELNRIVSFKSLSLENKIIYINLLYDIYYQDRKKLGGNTEEIEDFTHREEVMDLWIDLMNDMRSNLTDRNNANMALLGEINLYNLLILTVACHPDDVETVINCVKSCPTQLEKLLTHRDDTGANALIKASTKQNNAAVKILHAINNFSDTEQRARVFNQMLSAVTANGDNALMLASRHNTKAACLLLRAATDTKLSVLPEMLTAKDALGWNALMIAALYNPGEIVDLLAATKSLSPEDKVSVLAEMLTAKDALGWNALMIAALYNPGEIVNLLAATKSLSPEDKVSVLAEMLTARTTLEGSDSKCWNALMIAARYNPKQVPALLEATNSLHPDTQSSVLTDMLTAKNSDGWNALILAVHYNPESVPDLLEATNSLNPDTKSSVLTEMLKAKDSDGWNALMLANMRANKFDDDAPKKQLYHDAQKQLIDVICSLPTADRLDIIASMRVANRPSVTQHLIQQLEENQPITNTPAKPG